MVKHLELTQYPHFLATKLNIIIITVIYSKFMKSDSRISDHPILQIFRYKLKINGLKYIHASLEDSTIRNHYSTPKEVGELKKKCKQ